MNAIYFDQYGPADVLHYGQQPTPTPKPNQILVLVRASSVNPIDWKVRRGDIKLLTGFNFPMIPGRDVAGEVAAVGSQVVRFAVGDRVYGMADGGTGGANAEYALLAESAAAFIPQKLNFEQAGAVPLAALTALQALRDQGRVLSGDRVLINGASGGVGSFAVQLAKALGAGEVTGTASADNLELVRSLGADRALDYKAHDFTTDLSRYDVIFDAAGKSSFIASQAALRRNGRYVSTDPQPVTVVTDKLAALLTSKSAHVLLADPSGPDLALISAWLQAGTLRVIVDKTFPLAEAAAAHRYNEEGGSTGKVVLLVE